MLFVVRMLLLGVLLLVTACSGNRNLVVESKVANAIHANQITHHSPHHSHIEVGAEQLSQYLPLLKNKRVGLVVNQTSRVNIKGKNSHLVDMLLNQGIQVNAIFAPEHGFRGNHDAGEKVNSGVDEKTGIPVISIYGKNKKPSLKKLANIDVIIFDIQDVGVRFYTYISSMHYMMEAAAEAGKTFIVLDRPNPNGRFVDGPILEPKFASFVGMHKIPLLHGMTIGELAKMFVGEKWLKSEHNLSLTVVPVRHYKRSMFYALPIKPSPNLPNSAAIALYPSLGFFEATPISIGRGTDFPFQVIGHNKVHIGTFSFTPVSKPGSASSPKLMNTTLQGQDLRQAFDFSNTENQGIHLSYVINWYRAFKAKQQVFFTRAHWMDKLSGTDKLRKAILAGESETQIKQRWQEGITQFKKQRAPYLLYEN